MTCEKGHRFKELWDGIVRRCTRKNCRATEYWHHCSGRWENKPNPSYERHNINGAPDEMEYWRLYHARKLSKEPVRNGGVREGAGFGLTFTRHGQGLNFTVNSY